MLNQLLYGDNIEVMRKMSSASVDLIYLDPPFNSNRNYNFLYSQATGKPLPEEAEAFCDAWTLDIAKEEKIRDMADEMLRGGCNSEFIEFWQHWILALRKTNSKLLAYMVFMTERLVEMHRLLKPTGSIYLHCDPTASHYIKIIMDGIFGHENFRNEIVWQRTDAHNTVKKYGRIHDIIFFFTKGNNYYWETARVPYSEKMLKRYSKDETGRMFTGTVLTAPRPNSNSGKFEWRGTMPTAGRGWGYGIEQLEKWWSEGKILCKKDGTPRMDGLKKYLDEGEGGQAQSIWFDIPRIANSSKERLGYPTQKPLALLDRIIQASCPEDGIVFDPFCGCGTTVISAQNNKRKWIGVDICMLAVNSVEERLKNLFPLLQKGRDYRLDGLPTTVEQAIELARSSNTTKNEGRYQFQYWAIEKIGGFASTKKSGDGGVDGAMYFYKDMEGKKLGKMIVSVKSDKDLKIAYIRDLIGTLSNDNTAEMAGLLCIDEPTEGMRQECLKAGFYEVDYGMMGVQKFPKVQILTIKEIIEEGKIFQTPFKVQKKVAEHSKNTFNDLQGVLV